ncbi:sensor histidine kinase [Streptomyces sp. NPDC002845]
MLGQVRAAVAVPLVIVVVLVGVAVIVWRVEQAGTGQLLFGLACGVAVAALVGVYRARAAAAALHRVRVAESQRVMDAAAAVEKSVVWSAEELCRGERPSVPGPLGLVEDAGPAAVVEAVLGELQVVAVASLIRVHDESQSAVVLEMLRRLARREHALVGRALEGLSALEKLTDDPDLLAQIFAIDHLVTRVRRQVESTAVLGGESLRSVRRPVNVETVLRGAASEVVQYERVTVVARSVGTQLALPGHAGPDLSHLVAELIENACHFSDPATHVWVRAQQVAAGLAIEVEDRAMPMDPYLREKMNLLLAVPDEVDVSAQVRDGKIGLLTAAKIARRHGMTIRLSENATGGTTALVVVPSRLLVTVPPSGVAAMVSAAAPPSSAAAPPRPTPPAAAEGTSPARAVTRSTAPASGAGRPVGAPPLPKRVRGENLPPAEERPQAPTIAARPGLAAAFRGGMQAQWTGGTAAPVPVPPASGPGGPPAAHA